MLRSILVAMEKAAKGHPYHRPLKTLRTSARSSDAKAVRIRGSIQVGTMTRKVAFDIGADPTFRQTTIRSVRSGRQGH